MGKTIKFSFEKNTNKKEYTRSGYSVERYGETKPGVIFTVSLRQEPVNDQWNHHIASLKQINRNYFPQKWKVTAMQTLMEHGGQTHKWV